MQELIKLDKLEYLVINGVLVNQISVMDGAIMDHRLNADKIISLMLNKYSKNNNTPEPVFIKEGKLFYQGKLNCQYGVLEVDFMVRIMDSHLFIDRAEVAQ